MDEKLIELARQLGTVIRAYAGAPLEEGHALLALAAAFQEGASADDTGSTHVDLPMKLSADAIGVSSDDPFDLRAIGTVRLHLFSDMLRLERLTKANRNWPDRINRPAVSVRLDGLGHLIADAIVPDDDAGQTIRQLFDESMPSAASEAA